MELPKVDKVISAAEASALIPPCSTVMVDGSGGGVNEPDLVLRAIEERFLNSGLPYGLTLIHPSGMGDRKGGEGWIRMDQLSILQKAFLKIDDMNAKLTSFPHITRNGKWLTHDNGHCTGGFWSGLFWIKSLYSGTPDNDKETALKWSKKLSVCENDNKTDDMGFIFGPSCVFGYRITGDSELERLAFAGARNMIDLYEERSGLILAWDEPGYEGRAIVGTIMNLPLLIWTAQKTKKKAYYDIACKIADSIKKHHIRPEGSIYHMVRWDTKTFEIVEKTTHQGFSSETCWSRGQSWALYGFANMYRYTKQENYLSTALMLGEYFLVVLAEVEFLPKR
jgi:unsaturated chondroitin disaccharide hydrolase